MGAETRDYVVGLPVVVSVSDDGFVQVEVDLAELSIAIHESTHEGEDYTDVTIELDEKVLERWTETHSVKNEGYAALYDEDDLAFAREALGPDASDEEVRDLATLRCERDAKER